MLTEFGTIHYHFRHIKLINQYRLTFPMLKGFFTILGMSLVPSRYHDLIYMRKRVILKYLFFLLLFVIIITSFFYIPQLKILGSQLDREFSKFEKFNLDADVVTKESVRIGFITIDTNMDPSEAYKVKGILFTNDLVQINIITPSVIPITALKNVLQNTKTIKANIILITVLLAPYFFILYFFYNLVKYLLYAFIASILVLVLFRVMQQEVHFHKLIRISGFASVFLMLELFLKPFGMPWYIHTLTPIIIYLCFIIITNMYVESTKVLKDNKVSKEVQQAEDDVEDVFKRTKIPGLGGQ